MKKKTFLFTILFLIIEEGLKYLICHIINGGTISIIPNFFSLSYVENTGAAWSILTGRRYLLIGISIIMLFAIASIQKGLPERKLNYLSFSFLYAGVLGNLADRTLFGAVKDFFSFNFFGYEFPVFNVADIYIVISIILIIILMIKGGKNEVTESPKREENKNW